MLTLIQNYLKLNLFIKMNIALLNRFVPKSVWIQWQNIRAIEYRKELCRGKKKKSLFVTNLEFALLLLQAEGLHMEQPRSDYQTLQRQPNVLLWIFLFHCSESTPEVSKNRPFVNIKTQINLKRFWRGKNKNLSNLYVP